MSQIRYPLFLLFVLLFCSHLTKAQNTIQYGIIQDVSDPFLLTTVAYPNFSSANVTISTAVFSFYLPAGTATLADIPVLPMSGTFTNITGTWRIEKVTPALYATTLNPAADMLGNDVYQCILQNSPMITATTGQPVQLFSFRLPSDCIGGSVAVHTNNNSIQQALLNAFGININNQMSVSVNDAPATDIYFGNNPVTDDYSCPLDDTPDAVDDVASGNEDNAVTVNVTANDDFGTDGASAGTILITTPPASGTATVLDGGTPNNPVDDQILYTPPANFSGVVTLSYQICDVDNDCDIATVTITVNAVNDAPDAVNDTYPTSEDNAVSGDVTDNDTDIDGPAVNITLVTGPTNGMLTLNLDGSFTYTPNANFNGPDTYTYSYCDGGTPNQCDQATVTINVGTVNDAPNAVNDTYTGTEDNPVTGNVTGNDTDPDGPMVIITVVTNPTNGTLMLNTGGTFTYTPNANFNGTDTYTYSYCDGGTPNLCDQATVTINVGAVNDAPNAVDDTYTGTEDNAITGNVAGNDTDPDGPLVNITVVTNPTNGTLVLNPNGAFTYTPNANFNGTDTYVYSYCDGGTPNQCDQATVTLNIGSVNDTPNAVDDTFTGTEDNAVTGTVATNDTDADGPMVNITVVTGPTNGTLALNPNGMFTYTPNANFNGTDTYVYSYCDGGTPNQCDQATVTINLGAVNDAPNAVNDTYSGTEDNPITGNVTVNDTDPDGPMVNITLGTGPTNGTLTLNPDGTFTYNPNPNYNGPDGFTYLYCDGGTPNQCDPATVTFNVGAANDAPNAVDDTYTGTEDNAVTGNVSTNDTDLDGPMVNMTVVTNPANGTLALNTNGMFTYTPNANFNGTDTYVYSYCDGGTPNQCDQATVTINLGAVNDAPNAVDDTFTGTEDNTITGNVATNDTDPDGPMVNITVVTNPTNGTLVLNTNGTFTYTPNANFNGTDTYTYQYCDNGTPNQCDQATVTLNVGSVNDAPNAVNDTYTGTEDNPITGDVSTNDTDPDGPMEVITVITGPTNGTLTLNPGGTFTYTPIPNYNGPDGFTYQYCDNGTPNQCDPATVTLSVGAVNDLPNAVDDVATTTEDMSVPINVPANDTDVEGLNLGSVTIGTGPANGTVSVNNLTGVVTYTPNANFVGTDVFTYNICDNGTPPLCDQATVTVTVNATSVRLLAKMRLQGALYGTNGVLMRDTLRQLNRLPSVEPYSSLAGFTHVNNPGGETAAGPVFATTGANAIVDWVFIELRSASNPATVVKTRSALLQRDGDVVDVDGVSALVFENTAPASFYVAIRHRNHLGAMTAAAIALTNAGTTIDFTNLSTPLWDDNSGLNGLEQNTGAGKYALWAGNVNVNKSVVYAGQENDKNPIFNQVDQAPGNLVLHSQLYIYNGYFTGDVNMDGSAIFAGQKNDVDFIFNNVDGHPKNVLRSQTYVIRQQLAE